MSPDTRFSSRLLPRLDLRATFSHVADEHDVTPAAMDAFVEHLPLGVWMVDRDGRIVFANEAARALRVDGLEPLQWAITRALLTEEVVREEEIEVAGSQPRRWVSAYIAPVRVSGHGVTAALVTLSDVTARKRMGHWEPVIETLVNL